MEFLVIIEIGVIALLIGIFVWVLAKQEKKVSKDEDQ